MVRGVLLAICSSICYGLAPVIYKLGFRAGLAPADLLMSRFVVATPLLILYLALTNRALLRCSPATLGRAALVSCLFYAPQTASFAEALRYIPAATNSLILYFYPLTVTLLSALFWGFRLDRAVCAALLLTGAGVVFVTSDAFVAGLDVRGLGLAALTMVCYSGYLLMVQRFLRNEHPLTFSCWVFVCMMVVYAIRKSPAALLEYHGEQLLWAVLAGVFPTVLAVPLLYTAIGRIGSAYVSIASTFELVATLGTAALFLGEAVTPLQVAGMVAIMAGVAVPNIVLARKARQAAGGAATAR